MSGKGQHRGKVISYRKRRRRLPLGVAVLLLSGFGIGAVISHFFPEGIDPISTYALRQPNVSSDAAAGGVGEGAAITFSRCHGAVRVNCVVDGKAKGSKEEQEGPVVRSGP